MSDRTAYTDLLFDIRLSIRYHERRQAFLQSVLNLTLWLTLVSGSVSTYLLLTEVSQSTDPKLHLLLTGVASVFAATCLAYGIRDKAERHGDLKRRFIELEAEIRSRPENDKTAQSGEQKRLLIEADEPRVMRVLALRCHNQESLAMGYDRADLYKIGPIRSALSQLIDVFPDSIRV